MKKILLLIAMDFLAMTICFGQTKKQSQSQIQIKKTIIGFLKWYKREEADTTKAPYSLTTGGYPDTTTIARIDRDGVEQYLDIFRKSDFVSEIYIDGLRDYFLDVDKLLINGPIMHDLVKIPGMDIDFALKTFEPEAILDHIDNGRITKLYIIYNKATVSLHISRYIDMLFILTRQNNKWYIDYIGDDATKKDSFFLQ
jgi:hypothetical protein